MQEFNTNGAASSERPRSTADILSGIVRLNFDGRQYELPVLKISSSRKWKTKLAESMGTVQIITPGREGYNPAWGTQVANAASEQMVLLVAAYDEQGILAGRKGEAAAKKWLEENATERDLWEAFLEVLKATFPFVKDPRQFILEMIGEAMQISALDRVKQTLKEIGSTSMNGSSTNGESAPLTNLSPVSPTNN